MDSLRHTSPKQSVSGFANAQPTSDTLRTLSEMAVLRCKRGDDKYG